MLFVLYVGGMFKHSDWNERTGQVVSVLCSTCGWLGSDIAMIRRSGHTGHMVSVMSFTYLDGWI